MKREESAEWIDHTNMVCVGVVWRMRCGVWRVHTGFNCFETVRKADFGELRILPTSQVDREKSFPVHARESGLIGACDVSQRAKYSAAVCGVGCEGSRIREVRSRERER